VAIHSEAKDEAPRKLKAHERFIAGQDMAQQQVMRVLLIRPRFRRWRKLILYAVIRRLLRVVDTDIAATDLLVHTIVIDDDLHIILLVPDLEAEGILSAATRLVAGPYLELVGGAVGGEATVDGA
jgi:hypothetical protein